MMAEFFSRLAGTEIIYRTYCLMRNYRDLASKSGASAELGEIDTAQDQRAYKDGGITTTGPGLKNVTLSTHWQRI
jgi:hypothetical protein